jgi:sortase (surface protein transpeptidase)
LVSCDNVLTMVSCDNELTLVSCDKYIITRYQC